MKKTKITAACIFPLWLLANCGSVPQTFYYRVDYQIEDLRNGNHAIPLTLGIRQFDADVLYQGDRIVYRQSPYQVQFYHYRRWVAPPKKIVTEKVLKQFQASGLFANVVRIPSAIKNDYTLNGEIQAFEEWDEGGSWYGLVTIEFKLQNSDFEIVWQKVFSEKTIVEKKEHVEIVKAISQSLNKVVKDSIEGIKNNLKLIDDISSQNNN